MLKRTVVPVFRSVRDFAWSFFERDRRERFPSLPVGVSCKRKHRAWQEVEIGLELTRQGKKSCVPALPFGIMQRLYYEQEITKAPAQGASRSMKWREQEVIAKPCKI